jgi:predicted amidohydrolase YtcJ
MELDRYKEPTGLLRGKANEIASQYFKNRLDSEAKRLAFEEGVSFAVKKGITTLVAMTREEDLEILLNLLPSLPIQIVIFPQTLNIKKVKEFGLNRIGGCILIDGSFGSHTAALREEYSDKEGEKGILYFSDEELFNFQKEANENNLQMAFHCIGDRAIEQVLRGFEQIIKENPLRHRIEHCELVPPDLLARLAKIKIYPSVQPAFEYFWGGEGNMYHKRLGERIRFTNPYKSFLNNGLIPLGGSDSPITPLDPILGIKSAISHPNEKERLTRNEALSLFTKWGAEGIFLEDEIGVLKRNYWADFIVLKGDILKGEEGEVLAVYKRGKRIFSSL